MSDPRGGASWKRAVFFPLHFPPRKVREALCTARRPGLCAPPRPRRPDSTPVPGRRGQPDRGLPAWPGKPRSDLPECSNPSPSGHIPLPSNRLLTLSPSGDRRCREPAPRSSSPVPQAGLHPSLESISETPHWAGGPCFPSHSPTSHTPPPQAGLEPRVQRRHRPPGRPAWLIFARPALRGQQAGHQGLGGNAVRGPGLSWEVSYRDRPAPLTPRPHPGDGGEGRATVCTQGLGPGLTWGWCSGSKGCRRWPPPKLEGRRQTGRAGAQRRTDKG